MRRAAVGDPDAAVLPQNDLRLLAAQKRYLRDITGAGKHNGHLAVLLITDGLNIGRGVLLETLAQAQG